MNLHQLRTFLAVAHTGSFTAAAREVHLTQPTVSSGVAELERSMGVRLFNRNGRRISLTLEGRQLLAYAEQIQDLVVEARDRVGRGDPSGAEGFRFGAIDAAVIYLIPDLLRDYHTRFPEVEVTVQVDASRFLVEEILADRSEFALITLPFENAKIATIPIYQDTMPLVVGSRHPMASRRRVRLEEVAAETLILFHRESVSRRLVDAYFAEAGLTPGRVMEMSSPEAMRKLVEAGVGSSFLPSLTVQESVEGGTLKTLAVSGVALSRQIGGAWRRGRYFGPAIEALLNALFEAYGRRAEWDAAVATRASLP